METIAGCLKNHRWKPIAEIDIGCFAERHVVIRTPMIRNGRVWTPHYACAKGPFFESPPSGTHLEPDDRVADYHHLTAFGEYRNGAR